MVRPICSSVTFYVVGPIMCIIKKEAQTPEKTPMVEIPLGKDKEEDDIDTLGLVYDETEGFINKDTLFKLGQVYQMFSNQTFL